RSVFEETGLAHQGPDIQITAEYTPVSEPGPNGAPGPPVVHSKWPTGAATQVRGQERPFPAQAGLPLVPGYEILRELGQGGMGIVYEARDLQLQRLVALKMIRPGRDVSQGALARFLAEARAVAQFKHAHLVQIYEIDEHEGQPYLSLELVEGGSLKRRLAGTPQTATAAAARSEEHTSEFQSRVDLVC